MFIEEKMKIINVNKIKISNKLNIKIIPILLILPCSFTVIYKLIYILPENPTKISTFSYISGIASHTFLLDFVFLNYSLFAFGSLFSSVLPNKRN